MNKKDLLYNLDNPIHCQKIIKDYDELRESVDCNLDFFSELLTTNKKGFSDAKILRKAKQYFPVVDKSYDRMLKAFRHLFNDDNLEYWEIHQKLTELILSEHEQKHTGVNKENNDFLQSIGIKPELGGKYTSSELEVFSSAFLLMSKCRDMLAKLSTIYALFDADYNAEGETEEGFQY